jgi:hypothetical protein
MQDGHTPKRRVYEAISSAPGAHPIKPIPKIVETMVVDPCQITQPTAYDRGFRVKTFNGDTHDSAEERIGPRQPLCLKALKSSATGTRTEGRPAAPTRS